MTQFGGDGKRSVQSILDQLGFGWYQMRVITILGIAQATDTMEAIIQAILGPALRCEWNIDADHVALLATMVFLGVCIGSPPMGYLSDRLGRKSLIVVCCLSLIYMTILCAVSPTYMWLLILRFISGWYISGLLTAGNSMITEFLPEVYQCMGQLLVCSFDSIIGLFVTGVGFGCLVANIKWRYFLILTTPPLFLCIIGLSFCVHESPVILAQWGRRVKAAEVLDSVARVNRRIPLKKDEGIDDKNTPYSFVGRLQQSDSSTGITSVGVRVVIKLFAKDYGMATSLLSVISFIWGMLIYGGTTLLPVELPSNPRTCLQSIRSGVQKLPSPNWSSDRNHEDCCLPLLREGYISLLSSMIGSVLSFPVAFLLIKCIGRKWTICTCFFLLSILLFVEAFCLPATVLRVIFFTTRAIATAGNNTTTIYITGLYRPKIRGLAYGIMSTFYRIGVLTAPYLGQVFLHKVSVLGAVLIFSALALLGSILSFFLPQFAKQEADVVDGIETKENDKRSCTSRTRQAFRNVFKPRNSINPNQAGNEDAMRAHRDPIWIIASMELNDVHQRPENQIRYMPDY